MVDEKNFRSPIWMTEEGLSTLQKGYLRPGEDVLGMYERVASSASKYLHKEGMPKNLCDKFYTDMVDVLWKGYLGLATPVATDLGDPLCGLPISCYSVEVEDSVEGIMDSLHETAILTKKGGGVGVYLGNIRGRGSEIKTTGGHSNGVLPFARFFDEIAFGISKGNVRRGSFALYLPIDHKDILEFLRSKEHTKGDQRRWIDSNIAVVIPDYWMQEMLNGDESKLEIFSEVIRIRMLSGSPYLLFIDNVNNQNPPAYKNNKLEVHTSNLCFSGDTKIILADGSKKSLEDCYNLGEFLVPSYNGEANRNKLAVAIKTGTGELIELTLSNGDKIKCTPEHLMLVRNGGWVEANNTIGKELHTIGRGDPIHVVSISKLDGEHSLYDLKVRDFKNFYVAVGENNGVCVHNCSEIVLHTDKDHSFVCCLSSQNLDKFDEWKDYTTPSLGWSVPFISTVFLDAVLSEFIDKAKNTHMMFRAVNSAVKGRALGLGSMGLCSLFQRRMLPFSSQEAKQLNIEIHQFIQQEAIKATKFLAKNLGEPEWCKGLGVRNTHLLAVAPTRTNSVICNAISQGIEPLESNYFVVKQDKVTRIRKNPHLEKLLEEKGKNTPEVWDTINSDKGSVRSLGFLTDNEKEVFFTAREIDQKEIIRQASDRQPFIDQAQSVNLFFHTYASDQYIFEVHVMAWKLGLKSLYYYRTRSKQTLSTLNVLVTKPSCPFCHMLKDLLANDNVDYEELSVQEAKNAGIFNYDHKTVPQLFIDGELVGGYDDYKKKSLPPLKSISYSVEGTFFEDREESAECTSCEG